MTTPTAHDSAVLNAIFNPLLPLGQEAPQTPAPHDQQDRQNGSLQTTENGETAADLQAKELEVQGVKCAEGNDLDGAINFFNQAVTIAPNRASCYNNRAQALRLRGDVEGALEDLDKAIMLSQGRGKAACQAYTQRALIYKLERREEEALADFKCAANLGSQFARAQVVQMNPYAAMCNQMLAEVMGKLRAGEEEYHE